jgi:predicted small secreted protein
MKKLLLSLLVLSSLIACTNTAKQGENAEQAAAPVEHLYKPTYTDNFKVGDQKNVLLA